MVAMILAHDLRYGIGKDGKLPWRVKEDLKHFKQCTLGKDLIVGRKTAEGLPPLKGRNIYVVSRSGLSVEEALSKSENPIIIGGAEIYHYCLDNGLVDEIISTQINGEYDCDIFIRNNFFDGFVISKTEILGNGHIAVWYKKE
jgi:dihydrofolate reductase